MQQKRASKIIPSESRRHFLIAVPALFVALPSTAGIKREFVGTYSDEQIVAIKRLTFPRLHLYDNTGKLIDRINWPRDLREVKKLAGEAFCCVSDTPSAPGSLGPPPDCKVKVYGEDMQEHFSGLHYTSGSPIHYRDLPRHKYLIVEYFADWCSPCAPTKRALQAFLKSPSGKDFVVVVVDFSRLPKAQELLQQRAQNRQRM
ncbi:MAG: hypothetical protein WCB36_03770 [Burkholderiales bacterium]